MFEQFTDYFIPKTKVSSVSYRGKIGKFQGWISVAVNGILFIIKFSIGLIIGSVSVIADAVHTLSDVISSGVVIWGFHEAAKPADTKHPYGHGRVEYIATLIIAILLCVAGVEFVEMSIHRIANPEIVSPEWWMVGIMLFTVFIKEITARYAEFLSAKIASETLHADAWHHRTDAISSLLVVAAMISGIFGYQGVDGWAGLGVALFLIFTGFTIAKSAIDDLIGKPPTFEEIEEIRQIINPLEGVLGVHDIAVHSYGKDQFVNIHIEIDANNSPTKSHDIAENIETILSEKLGVEPTIHIDPIFPDNPKVQEVKDFFHSTWMDDKRINDIHDVRVIDSEKHKIILFGFNVSPGISNSEVQECCSALERSFKEKFHEFDVNVKVSPLHRF